MLKQKLAQIDQALVELLSQRIAVLAQLEAKQVAPSLDEQSANMMPALTQAGVPALLWQSLVTGCTAALANPVPSPTRSRRVTIIGGRGLMGSFFQQWLSAAGHQVKVLERDDWEQAGELLSGIDMALVCVPLDKMPAVICKTARYLDGTTALMDVASIKTPVMKAMLEHYRGPVMGLHPMFGGGIKSFLSQNVVVCPGRGSDKFQWFLALIEQDGGRTVSCTAAEHDQMMTAIQAIRHFAAFSLGVFLTAEEIDIRRSLAAASPTYRIEVGLISRLFSHYAPLSIDLMLAFKQRRDAIARLAKTYNRLAQLVVQQDREALIQEFEAVQDTFAQQTVCTPTESTHLINALSTLLAAQQVSH